MKVFLENELFGVKDGDTVLLPPIFDFLRLDGNMVHLFSHTDDPNNFDNEFCFDISIAKYFMGLDTYDLFSVPILVNDSVYNYRIKKEQNESVQKIKVMLKNDLDEIVLSEQTFNVEDKIDTYNKQCQLIKDIVINCKKYITNYEVESNTHFLLMFALEYRMYSKFLHGELGYKKI